jgi:uncharacterized protein (TIGR03546 family)
MLLGWIRPLRYLAAALAAEAAPRQLALAIALGTVLGLVPKGNLTAAALVLLLFVTRVNLGAGLITALIVSGPAFLLDPLSHAVGARILTVPWLQPVFAFLYNLPLMPWTALNNTVVFGSLILGAGLFYPVYRLSWLACEKYQPRVTELLNQNQLAQLLLGAETARRWRVG